MKRFDDTGLREVLKTPDSPSLGQVAEPDDLLDELIVKIHEYCREEKDMAERSRSLNYLRGKLAVYAEEDVIELKICKFLRRLIKQAIYFIDSEIDLAKMQIEYPERFITFPDDPVPLARWNGKPHELIEYIMPLQLDGKFLKPSGEPMTFIEMVRAFELFCGITVAKPHDIKMRLLTRKKNVTPFIDRMRVILREASEKSYL
jgi:hypothetical protein